MRAPTLAIHTLTSLAPSIGAETLRKHAQALELAVRGQDEPALTAGAPAVEQELAVVLATLEGFLGARASG